MSDERRPKANIYRGSQWKKDRHGSNRDRLGQLLPCQSPETCCAGRFIGREYDDILEQKYQAGLARLNGAKLLDGTQIVKPAASPRPLEYRTHAKLAVRPRGKCRNPDPKCRFGIGFFAPGSHTLIDISRCPMHRHSINNLIADLKPELHESTLEPYNEDAHTGDLRYLAIRASHLTDEVMLTFVLREDSHKIELRNMITRLRQRGHKINSAHININPDRTNAIFGEETRRIAGTDRLRERLCDLDFEIGPTSFFQVNPWQAENIYQRVALLAGQNVANLVAWDLYCGIGQMSMLLARAGYRVLGIEENAQATRDAQNNSIRNEIENPPHFMAGRVEDLQDHFPSWATRPDLIVANPSRRGLADQVRHFLAEVLSESKTTTMFYVSCEAETMARDLEDLVSTGRRVSQLEAFDMFPYTDKMEWLAVIS